MLSDKFKSARFFFEGLGLNKEEAIEQAIKALEDEMNADPTMQETFYEGPAGTFIPMRMLNPIKAYIEQGLYPGSFLMAIIENNLIAAVGHADDHNVKNIPAFVSYFHNIAPPECWGTSQKSHTWMNKGGLSGVKEPE